MRGIWLILSLLSAGGCGRLLFEPSADAGQDAQPADANPTDGQLISSCAGLPAACGPSGTAPCCSSTVVSGGAFYRGFDVGSDNAYPDATHPATVSDFRLDTYEVTVGRFRQFVNAGMGTQASPPPAGTGARTLNGMPNQAGWEPAYNAALAGDTTALIAAVKCGGTQTAWTDAPGTNEVRAMNCITWYEAAAFCAWDGGFLPTEAEWNYAAVGGAEQRAFPWSSPASSLALDCSYAHYSSSCTASPGTSSRVGRTSPKGDGKHGHSDLAGNVWEWTLDTYHTPYISPCIDCADLAAGNRVIRGGGLVESSIQFLRGANRTFAQATTRYLDLGVRCARMP